MWFILSFNRWFYHLIDEYTETIRILQQIYGATAECVTKKHDARSRHGKHKWNTTGYDKTK